MGQCIDDPDRKDRSEDENADFMWSLTDLLVDRPPYARDFLKARNLRRQRCSSHGVLLKVCSGLYGPALPRRRLIAVHIAGYCQIVTRDATQPWTCNSRNGCVPQ